jgi:hypothetical protein
MNKDRLFGPEVRAPGCKSRSPGSDSRRYQMFCEVVSLERGPLNLVSITEELIEWRISCSGSRSSRLTAVGIRCADHATPSILKIGTNFAVHAAGARPVKFACGLKPRSLV